MYQNIIIGDLIMDIYELLNKIIINKSFSLSSHLFTSIDREKLDKNDIPLFDILKDISSLGTEINNHGIKFHPMYIGVNGNRTFSVEDLTDDNYKILKTIDFQRVPLNFKGLSCRYSMDTTKRF